MGGQLLDHVIWNLMAKKGVRRREFIGAGAAFGVAGAACVGCVSSARTRGVRPRADAPEIGRAWQGWRPGDMDVHFIHTGVGEQTFFIFPDGTTMLLDCGDTHHAKYMADVPPMPSAERLGGEWTSRYIQRLVPQREIDYLMVSHWHGDHVGDPPLGCRVMPDGRKVCGITAVAEDFKFLRYFDHQHPRSGEYALDPDPEAYRMMQEWLPRARMAGMEVNHFEVGALNQIALVHDRAKYPDFEIRNVAANAVLWDGKGGVVDYGRYCAKTIHENRLSAVIRIRYGAFSYYTGGDAELTLVGADGRPFNWEAAIGRVVGPVNVAKTNHHAGVFGMSADFVKEIRAQVYLSSVWQARMVDPKSLDTMTSRELYGGDRIVCFGYHSPAVRDVVARYARGLAPAGHVVVKVPPGGRTYAVSILDASDESMRVKMVYDCAC